MSRLWYRHTAVTFPIVLLLACQIFAQSTGQARKQTKEFDLSGDKKWLDTEIDVQPGDTLLVTATGSLRYPMYKENGPEGLPRGWRDLLRIFPLSESNHGALIGRIGADTAQPFLIGPSRESRVTATGRFYLGLNQTDTEHPDGSFHVKVEFTPRAAAPPPIDASKLPVLTQKMLDQIPTRVKDAEDNLGDRVNFLIIGSEDKVKRALQDAGWVQVNRTTKDAFIQGALATFSRQAYTQMPMSELRLFNRPQDFGYAHADPLVVVAARHHFRIWKAPFQVQGQTLWVGAGTHDIGLEKDQRNGRLTHKIDSDTDKEREYIAATLQETGEVAKLSYITASQPVTDAKTATGGGFHSDGRTLIIILNPDQSDVSTTFSNLFCTVLRDENPDGGEWGECSQYLETPAKEKIPLGPIPNKYRLLIVPGLMNTCFAGAPAFKEGQAYLREKFGLTVEILSVPNNSCEDNARAIGDYIRNKMKEDSRKYIVLGYSKGTPDLQVALAQESGVASSVAAFLNVAGASGGSAIADAIPGVADRWIKQYSLPNCQGDLSQGFKSLSQMVRHAFLSRYPDPVVPTYSLPAISSKTNTSKMLLQAWQLLSTFGDQEDSQLTKSDATIPGSKYLGAALADHFAIALPFETSNESIKSGADKNHYPRTALLEAMVRFVIRDLENPK
jgi:hypothetical protein